MSFRLGKTASKTFGITLALAFNMALIGCATDGVGRYRVASIGNAARAVEATVLSARPAYIQEGTSGAGATAGGALGGVAAGSSDNAGVILAGIIVGAVIGEAIEQDMSRANATQYVLRTETDATLVVAQLDEGNEIFVEGDRVILVYGYPAQLLRAP